MITNRGQETIAALADGGFITTYNGWDGTQYNIYMQRYDASGGTVGAETRVSSPDADGGSTSSQVVAHSDGGWTVIWSAPVDSGNGVSEPAYLGQRYDILGEKTGDTFTVAGPSFSLSQSMQVTPLGEETYVVAWGGESAQGEARILNADGAQQGTAISFGIQSPYGVQVSNLDDDRFALTWFEYNSATQSYNTYAQLFRADTGALGDAFQIPQADISQRWPNVLGLPNGTIAVLSEDSDPNADSYNGRNILRIFDTSGEQIGSGYTLEYSAFGNPEMLRLPDNRILIAWTHEGGPDSDQDYIAGQYFNLSGTAQDAPFELLAAHSVELAFLREGGIVAIGTAWSGDTYGPTLKIIDSGIDLPPLTIGTLESDNLIGSDADELIDGLSGNDTLSGAAGNDSLDGGAGEDALLGADGQDLLSGGAGRDTLQGNTDEDTLDGGDGDDILDGGEGDDSLTGGANDDSLTGGPGDDSLTGGTGDDTLQGDDGADTLQGAEGADALYGGAGLDVLLGDLGDDSLWGGEGHDRLAGDAGHDSLAGEAGRDSLEGGSGDDNLQGGEGHDTLSGGSDNDQLHGGLGADLLRGDDGQDSLFGEDGSDLLLGGNGADALDGGTHNDTLEGGADDDALLGGAGHDLLTGGHGYDTLDGGDGNDTLDGGLGDDLLQGGDKNDQLSGGQGHDTLSGGQGHDLLDGSSGNDQLSGGGGQDSLLGGTGSDRLSGDNGHDLLQGGSKNDHLDGGTGKDTLDGGSGRDSLTGGKQSDVFVFADGAGKDRITDFSTRRGPDALDLSDLTEIEDYEDLMENHITDRRKGVVISDGDGTSILLEDVALAKLAEDHFLF